MSSLRPSPISPAIDYDHDGVQHGYLRCLTADDSAWGSVMIPICVVRKGKGSTALLTGADHGDEDGGPLALAYIHSELCRTMLVPMMETSFAGM